MHYNLYTFPNCGDCESVKDFLNGAGIKFSEVNLGGREGKKEFGKIYAGIESQLKRDEKKSSIILPMLIRFGDGGVEAIAQGIDETRALFG